ncbi:DUF305 domain-containing protein [Ferrimonas balearica]|nr:DUF305 domain-containing protein [Ferrimonas balearica]
MSYIRFGLMIATSTIIMFILMYLNTYAWEHLFFSETRAYMAILMGATMAIVMLSFMLAMYSSKALNIAIFLGAAVVFAGSLWLVRSQVSVSGPSYMRAMIPHHSIAVMTSERAGIEDSRVRKLADEIIAAQRKEIAQMRHLIADVSRGNVVTEIYEDPAAQPGSVQDALNNTLISKLDLAPLPEGEATQVLEELGECRFNRSPEDDPILWTGREGGAAAKLNGVLVGLQSSGGEAGFASDGMEVEVRPLGDDADWRGDAELTFALDAGLTAGYRGFWSCG